jgi:type 1 glutamine amidotransferase
MKQALIVQGGWQGHEPKQVADILAGALREHGFEVEVADTLDAFKGLATKKVDLVIPEWTMGKITGEQLTPLLEAIRGGVGAAGVHGGMGDAFRDQCEYQFMVGGQWVAHPGGDGVTYQVHIEDLPSPITKGLKDFTVTSEQYYMHVDPGNTVLATTRFADAVVPVAWTKHYGKGRVFYCSLGHKADVARQPEVLTLVTRGMLWAAGSL